jgi:hypothetical protein
MMASTKVSGLFLNLLKQIWIVNDYPDNQSKAFPFLFYLPALGTRPISWNPSFLQIAIEAGLLAKTRLNMEALYPMAGTKTLKASPMTTPAPKPR